MQVGSHLRQISERKESQDDLREKHDASVAGRQIERLKYEPLVFGFIDIETGHAPGVFCFRPPLERYERSAPERFGSAEIAINCSFTSRSILVKASIRSFLATERQS